MSMENIILTILTILTISFLVCVYSLIRNDKVYKFRGYIIDLIYSRASDMINEGASYQDISYLWNMLEDISYDEMLYSFKPLKMEYWFTDDELKLLGYEKDLQSHR